MASKNQLLDYEPLVSRPKRGTASTNNYLPKNAGEVAPQLQRLMKATALTPPDEHTQIVPSLATAKKPDDKVEVWSAKRGHTLAYIGLFLFTFVLYFRPYDFSPSLSFLSTSAFWIAMMTLAVFIPSQFGTEGNLTARPREVNILLLFSLMALLSIPLAISPPEAWAAFNESFLKIVLIFIVMINVVRTDARLKGIIFLSLVVGTMQSVLAINAYRLGNLTVEGYRVTGVDHNLFGNPNDMALHLVMMIPLAVVLMISTSGLVKKAFYGICGVLMLIGTVLTFSRGGFLGLLAGSAVLAWKLGRRNRVAVVLIGLVVITLFILLAPGNYGIRILSIFDHSLDPVASASARQDILIRSLLIALAHPVFGIGMGNFHIVSIHELVSHNAYTQVAAELGFPALILYVMFIIVPFKELRRIEKDTFEEKSQARFYYLAIGLQASLVAYVVSSFFGSVAYLWYIYYLVGFAICFRRLYKNKAERVQPQPVAYAE